MNYPTVTLLLGLNDTSFIHLHPRYSVRGVPHESCRILIVLSV